jgi:diguanylate cyclase (GGDEF)-like protein
MQVHNGVVAILTDEYIDYRKILVDRISSVLQDEGFGTVCLAGRKLSPQSEYHVSYDVCNRVYALAEQAQFDGIVCLAGALASDDVSLLGRLVRKFSTPLVTLGLPADGRSAVLFNDVAGMQDLMKHLLVDSERRNFAFIRGKDHDKYSMEREDVFRQMLMQRGYAVNESRFVYGNYDSFDAYRVTLELLNNDRDIDVIVAANDSMALGAARAVNALGLRIPQDVLVSGFDDTPETTRNAPALTSVRQPLTQMAEKCARELINQIFARKHGRDLPPQQYLGHSELVVRGSTLVAEHNLPRDSTLDLDRLNGLLQALMSGLAQPSRVDIDSISSALWDTLTNGSDVFPQYCRELLQAPIESSEVHWWTNLCHHIETLASAHLSQNNRINELPLISASLAGINEKIWSVNMDREFEVRRLENVQSEIQLQMSACTEFTQILSTMARWLETTGARRCFLVKFDQPSPELHEFSSVIQVYRNGEIEFSPQQPFRTRLLLPASMADELRKGLLVLNPVFAGSDLFGYLLLDPTGLDRLNIASTAYSLGNAMRNQYLINKLEMQTDNLQKVNKDLVQIANYDALTKLPNRLHFQQYLHDSCNTTIVQKQQMCLLFIDLDGFKLINDSLGHGAGDLLLRIVAKRLNKVVENASSGGGFISRLGGDEFTVILNDIDSSLTVERLANDLLHTVSQPYSLGDSVVNVSASIGYAFFPQHGSTARELLKSADVAMYRAKELGKNRIARYTPDMSKEAGSQYELDQALREALTNGELQMYFQPRIDLATGEMCAVEALMRWIVQTPEGEEVRSTPDVFIPVAEKSGFIGQLDTYALETCCAQCREWAQASMPLVISINLSVVVLQQDDFVESFIEIAQKYQVDPSLIELEITESSAMKNVQSNVEKLGRLREFGVGISIDDFGTGYSSLNYLKKLPVNNLKVDRTFIQDITAENGNTGTDAAIVKSVVALGKSMEFGLVAEGIETQQQLDFVKGLGCDQAQGYFYSRPVPAAVITERLYAAQQLKRAA